MFKSLRLSLLQTFQHASKRYAGHSKWQNIRHTKSANDTARSQLFGRLGHRIKIAIAENGKNCNPETNHALALAIEVCKEKNMPNATIQSYIKQSQVDKSNAKSVWFDLQGPNGIFFIVNTYTDNPNKTKVNIRSCIKKHRLSLESNLKANFSHKGIIRTKPKTDGRGDDILDKGIDDAIAVGAEDAVQDSEDSGVILFYCNPLHVIGVKKKLMELDYEIIEADDYFIPIKTVGVSDDVIVEDLGKAIDKLQALPEVVKIYDNIQ